MNGGKTPSVVSVIAVIAALVTIGFGVYAVISANKVASLATRDVIATEEDEDQGARTAPDNIVLWKRGQDLLIESIIGVDINLTNKDDRVSNRFIYTDRYEMDADWSVGYYDEVFGKLYKPDAERTKQGELKDGGMTDFDVIFDNSGRNVYYNTRNPISGSPNAANTDEIQYINGKIPTYVLNPPSEKVARDYSQANPKLPPINWEPDEVIHAIRVYDITNLIDRIPCPWTEKEGAAVNIKNQVIRFLDPRRAKREDHHVTGYWEDDHNYVNVAVPKFITGADGIRCHISGDAFVISLDPESVANHLWSDPDNLREILFGASHKDLDWDAFEEAIKIVKAKKANGKTIEDEDNIDYVKSR